MSFLNPEYFWLLLFLLPLFILKNAREFRVTTLGYILTFIFIVIAIARPVIEQQPIENVQQLSDVVIAVDLSYSMQAQDIEPSRLGYAKEILTTLVKNNLQNRYGVLGFTTNAILLSPLTQDSEILLHLFNSLDEKLIITRGSSVMPALQLARKISHSKSLSVVLLSDGADEVDYTKEAKFAKKSGLIVNTFMIGTEMGSTLPLENGKLLEDELGHIVVSRLNENIATISHSTGGISTDSYRELLSALEEQKQKDFKSKSMLVQNMELFYYFISLALIIFLLTVTTLKRALLAFFLLFGLHLEAGVLDFVKNPHVTTFKEANLLYREGEYEKALHKYESVKSSSFAFKSQLYYNMANTLVRLGEFKKAREAYKKSLTLLYTQEAYENLLNILDVKEQEQMSTGQQKSKKNSSIAKERDTTAKKKKKKSGGSSNMKVQANAGSGAMKDSKKSEPQNMLNLNSAKAKLSSKQYELVNKRSLNEKKPW
jgi:Ca-activated chloride channel family protein